MAKRDYYEILGIDRNADQAVLKKAYRNLAMQTHPDKNPGDAEAAETMKQVNEAYAVLCDSRKRALYDRYGHAGLEGYTQEDIFRGVDFGSLFREFGLGGFGFGFGDSIFEGLFGGRNSARRRPRRGADLRYDLSVTLKEAAFGTVKTIVLPKVEKCSACGGTGAQPGGLVDCRRCRGTGQIVMEQRSGYSVIRQITVCGDCRGRGKTVKKACKECRGKGIGEKTKEISVDIPAGCDTGYRIRVDGEGAEGDDLPGDLYIVIDTERDPVFERHGDDVYLQKEISFTTASLGGQVDVPGLEGSLKLDIPEGTQTGAVLRITGEGIPGLNGHGRGDEYVIVKVVVPTKLSRREKELLRELETLRRRSRGESHGEDRES
ncbi:MAG: molecular chaperone DnaJ [Chloroflexi bacterium RBG_13_60_13]|nr:MAG: molecular chaperone DnaJ [Chloroflexi bacterium RBG_13_60_13]